MARLKLSRTFVVGKLAEAEVGVGVGVRAGVLVGVGVGDESRAVTSTLSKSVVWSKV
jgi:hypothetical protein